MPCNADATARVSCHGCWAAWGVPIRRWGHSKWRGCRHLWLFSLCGSFLHAKRALLAAQVHRVCQPGAWCRPIREAAEGRQGGQEGDRWHPHKFACWQVCRRASSAAAGVPHRALSPARRLQPEAFQQGQRGYALPSDHQVTTDFQYCTTMLCSKPDLYSGHTLPHPLRSEPVIRKGAVPPHQRTVSCHHQGAPSCEVGALADGAGERRGSVEGTSASEAGTVFGRSATPSPSHEPLPPRRRSSRSVTGPDPVLCSTLQVTRLCCVWQQLRTRLLSHCVQRPRHWTGCLQAECRPAVQGEPFCGILFSLWSVLPM